MQELSSPEQRRLGLMFFIFSLSGSFIAVFLPAYYLIIGSGSMGWALQFLAVQFVALAIVPSVLIKALPTHFEALLFASFPCYILYDLLLIARADPVLTGVVAGVALSLFWPAFQTVAVRVAHKRKVASTFTVLWLFVTSAASVAGPVTGGVVISFGGGFATALGVSVGLYLIAFLSMWRFRFESVAYAGRPKERQGPGRLNYFLAVILVMGITDVSWLAYPLFALSVAGNFVNLGIVISLIGVITAVVGIAIGRASDRVGNRFGFSLLGIAATTVSLVALIFVKTVPGLLAVSVISGIASSATGPVLIGWFADDYTEESVAPFWTRFEAFLNPGRLVNLGLAAFFLPGGNFAGYFVASGALGLLAIPPLVVFKIKGGQPHPISPTSL